MSDTDPEAIARTIAQRQIQIEQISTQLLDSLRKVAELESSLESLNEEKDDLLKKLERRNLSIKQETCDIQLLKSKIEGLSKKTWGQTFGGIKSWIGSKTGLFK